MLPVRKRARAVEPLCDELRILGRRRQAAIRSMNSLNNQSRGFVMALSAYDNRAEAHDRDAALCVAQKVLKFLEEGGALDEEHREIAKDAAEFVHQQGEARRVHEAHRDAVERRIEAVAKLLPVYERFVEPIRGMGPKSLGMIIASTGNLTPYPTHSHVWKRLGLAVIGGQAQGRGSKTDSKEAWIERGYSPQRRSVVWNVGDPLIKSNKGIYRQAYDERKAYEVRRAQESGLTVVEAGKYPKGVDKALCISKAHIANRAQRYMEKKLIRHLYYAWLNPKWAHPEP